MKTNSNIETVVGMFLLLGIAIICTLIIFFGSVGDMLKPVYTLTVKFPDASGLLKGSSVYLSGAEVGKVITDPQPLPDTQEVEVKLKINKSVHIRTDAMYSIGSSGLLGDRFVEVKPHAYNPGTPEGQKAPYVEDGAVIEGANEPGLQELTDSALPLIEHANRIAAQLDDMITRLNTQVFSGTSTDDLKQTITKLREMVNNGDELLAEAKDSKGTVGRLINDRQMADNLRDFISNLKQHGVLFYSDTSGPAPSASSPTTDRRDDATRARR
jgi:ABC-type transporter Mla subunit MlaD